MSVFKMGDYIKNKVTKKIGFVNQVFEDSVHWTSEDVDDRFDADYQHFVQGSLESEEFQVLDNFVITASGTVYETYIDTDGVEKITLPVYDFDMETHRSAAAAHFEQIFMKEGWQDLFEIREDIVFNMCMQKFHLPEFNAAVNHFLEDGCPHWLEQLAETDDE